MIRIHDDKVNKIAECNLLHDIINIPKLTNNFDSHYSPILHVYINIRKGRARFKNFRILLDNQCSSTIVMVRLIKILSPEKDVVMQWYTQAVNITNNNKVGVDFSIPALSTKKFVTWIFHVDYSARGRYDMILGRYLLTELGLILNLFDHVVEADLGPF